MTLSIETWMRSARSGSSLMAMMPRCARGMSPKWMVSGSPRLASATFIGSMSPTRSATEVSGVASSRCSVRCDVAIRSAGRRAGPRGPANRRRGDGLVGDARRVRARDHRRPLVEQADQGAQDARLALAAFAEHHDVVAGEERPLELGNDGRLEADDAGPRVGSLHAGRSGGCCASRRGHRAGCVRSRAAHRGSAPTARFGGA